MAKIRRRQPRSITSKLYIYRPLGLPGDFNIDGIVDGADFTVWRDNLGAPDESSINGNGDGMNGVDLADYDLWTANFGMTAPLPAIPEPTGFVLTAMGLLLIGSRHRRVSL